MRSLSILLLTIVLTITNVYTKSIETRSVRTCWMNASCSDKPYHDNDFGHFIGFTEDDCRNDHIYICPSNSRNANYCYKYKQQIGAYMCIKSGPLYNGCYDYKGNKISIYSYVDSYENPFNNDKHCKANEAKIVTVNAKDSNCYYSAYGNKVLVKNTRKRDVKVFRKENGRCLVGNGWCPC